MYDLYCYYYCCNIILELLKIYFFKYYLERHSSSSSEEDDENHENEEDEPVQIGVEVISPVESWEENWLFQRRRLKTAGMSQSMPVPMLVPNPAQDEPRARIGDIDIDETSDLSDCSDSALEDVIDGPGNI